MHGPVTFVLNFSKSELEFLTYLPTNPTFRCMYLYFYVSGTDELAGVSGKQVVEGGL